MEFTTADRPVCGASRSAIGEQTTLYISIFHSILPSPSAPGDYTSVTRQLSFDNTTTEFNVSVPIIDDDLTELEETFLANFRLVSAVGRVYIAPSQATVNIQSDDRELFLSL